MNDQDNEQDRQREELQKQNARILAYKRLFETEDGKIVLNDLIRMYDTEPPLVIGDPHGTHYAVGQQSVVKSIFKKLKMDIETKMDNLTQ